MYTPDVVILYSKYLIRYLTVVFYKLLSHSSDYQVKLSEKFDQLGGVIRELANAGNTGDTSVIKSSVANLERIQNNLVRQIESTG